MLVLPLVAVAAAAVVAWSYWPGLMTWDSVHQYDQALSGNIDDWHPPMMQWIWRQAISIDAGPAPMLILQLALYWGGLTLLALAMGGRRKIGLGFALLACGLLPLGFVLSAVILKDSLMAAALLVAVGLLAIRQERGSVAAGAVAAAMLLFAATLRFNAFAACFPLLVALLPRSCRKGWIRLLLASAVATLALMAVMPLANRLIGAKPSSVGLSLVIFDLAGITERSGVNVFPDDLEVADPIGANHHCYRADKWDSYSDWVNPECPLGYTAWNDSVDPTELHPYVFWVHAMLAHPIAYSEHRLTHFAFNTRILPLADTVERPVPETDAPNPWGFRVTPNPTMRAADALAVATAHTPLGWPIVWMGLALGTVMASWGVSGARLIVPLGLSSFLYGCGYLVFSVAADLRYHLWTELAALLAVVLALSESEIRGRKRLAWMFAPAGMAVLAGVIGRALAAA